MNSIERMLIQGDLGTLSESDRISYYSKVCESLGLNPLTQPFAYIKLNGKLCLYAKRECTEQLRKIYGVSINVTARELVQDTYVVTARATLPSGRCDESIGAVGLGQTSGDARANLIMKAETKAKRRVTLSICGLGLLDETEVETIPGTSFVPLHDITAQPWKQWKSEQDALTWAASQLPDYSLEKLQAEFASLSLVNGKKSPAWVDRVIALKNVDF